MKTFDALVAEIRESDPSKTAQHMERQDFTRHKKPFSLLIKAATNCSLARS
jgi:hypothetical protein